MDSLPVSYGRVLPVGVTGTGGSSEREGAGDVTASGTDPGRRCGRRARDRASAGPLGVSSIEVSESVMSNRVRERSNAPRKGACAGGGAGGGEPLPPFASMSPLVLSCCLERDRSCTLGADPGPGGPRSSSEGAVISRSEIVEEMGGKSLCSGKIAAVARGGCDGGLGGLSASGGNSTEGTVS